MNRKTKTITVFFIVALFFTIYKLWIINPMLDKFPVKGDTVILHEKEFQIIYSTEEK